MKHVACGGAIEIRTDPKNTAYVVTEGARKRDLGEDKVEEGDIKIMTQEEREARRDNAFAALEGKVEDKKHLEYSTTGGTRRTLRNTMGGSIRTEQETEKCVSGGQASQRKGSRCNRSLTGQDESWP
jgi:hypothetical protein